MTCFPCSHSFAWFLHKWPCCRIICNKGARVNSSLLDCSTASLLSLSFLNWRSCEDLRLGLVRERGRRDYHDVGLCAARTQRRQNNPLLVIPPLCLDQALPLGLAAAKDVAQKDTIEISNWKPTWPVLRVRGNPCLKWREEHRLVGKQLPCGTSLFMIDVRGDRYMDVSIRSRNNWIIWCINWK